MNYSLYPPTVPLKPVCVPVYLGRTRRIVPDVPLLSIKYATTPSSDRLLCEIQKAKESGIARYAGTE